MTLPETLTGDHVDVKIWTPIAGVEAAALEQLRNAARLPWAFHHVAVMPDVHFGKGATVGSVLALKGAVSPAAVGVDIGCGMGAVRTSLTASDLPDNLEGLRAAIEAAIPVGFHGHDDPLRVPVAMDLFNEYERLDPKVQDLCSRARSQVGTLGGGNHFIEVCLADNGDVWLMLHSGSRNIGKTIADVHIERAKKLAHNQDLPDPDLAVFLAGTDEMKAYRHDLYWAQRYAFLNRSVMFALLKQALEKALGAFPLYDTPIMCHHNYVSEEIHFGEEVFVTRKGAISARHGEMGIIPGSMGTRSYIVRGLGNEASFHSASHGAGRLMSRGAAKRKFTMEDFAVQTAGVCCRKDADVLDEIPGAYKDIDAVMANQGDLVEVVAGIKQILCVKG